MNSTPTIITAQLAGWSRPDDVAWPAAPRRARRGNRGRTFHHDCVSCRWTASRRLGGAGASGIRVTAIVHQGQ